MTNIQYILQKSLSGEKFTYFDGYLDFVTRVETFGKCVESGCNSKTPSFPIFVIQKS